MLMKKIIGNNYVEYYVAGNKELTETSFECVNSATKK